MDALAFRQELDMIESLYNEETAGDPGQRRVIQLLGEFQLGTVRSTHYCLVLEPMYCDLSHLLETKGRLPLQLVKIIARQFLEGLAFLHKCSIIHTDIKPANVLVSWEKSVQSLYVKIIDFGNACMTDDHDEEDEIQTPAYRAPEAVLGLDYDTSADVWSAACLIFELAMGRLMLYRMSSAEYSWSEGHLACIIEVLGPIPNELILRSELAEEFFDQSGQLRNVSDLSPHSLEDVLIASLGQKEGEALAAFLRPMLEFDPDRRASAKSCLQHPWLSGE
ncbi:hypothetical protein KR222_001359 [Zaprionus bogoriensis]|nr:hypothetical protein KR222_001359 [Zaprionus bogoriensis]